MVERAGWRTAAHFTGAEDEARRVRDGAGLGDVSWLGKLDVRGTQTGRPRAMAWSGHPAPPPRAPGGGGAGPARGGCGAWRTGTPS